MTAFSAEPLRSAFTGSILVDGDEGFAAFPFAVGAPSVVVRPETVDDVTSALLLARQNTLAVSVRSGGHSGGAWTSTAGGLVLDMSAFADIDVDGEFVTIGTGSTWGAVAAALQPHGLAISSGDTKSVGVGGLTLGGGLGWLVRKYGLALDSLVAARIVTANGDLVTASAGQNAELFWAIRGGGGNFGVVLDFTFRARRLDGVVHGVLALGGDLAVTIRGVRDVLRSAPEELNVTLMRFPAMGGEPAGAPSLHVLWAGSDLDEAMAAIQPLLDLPGVTTDGVTAKPYADALEDPHLPPPGTPVPTMVGNNGWLPELSDAAVEAIAAMAGQMPSSMLVIRFLLGAFNRVPADSTAFGWRDAEALVMAVAFLPPGADAALVEQTEAMWQPVAGFTVGTYGNFAATAGERIVTLMYPPQTRARLELVKREWDPKNLFNQNQNVGPPTI